MIDQEQRIKTLVKDEVSRLATANGLDKASMGYVASFTVAPQMDEQGNQMVGVSVIVAATLRMPVLTADKPTLAYPVVVPLPPGLLSPDAAIRGAVEMSVSKVVELRNQFEAQMNQAVQMQGPSMPLSARPK